MSDMLVTNPVEIPVFPLRTLLMPEGILPLRIFEPRYIDMVSRCMKEESGFGICAIREARKAPSAARQSVMDIFDIGTLVKIVDFEPLSGGMLGLTVAGKCKFRIIKAWQQEDQLGIAQVEYLPLEKNIKITKENTLLSELLRRIMPDVEEYYGKEHFQYLKKDFNNASWVGSRLIEFLPINLEVKQMLLECDDPLERLSLLRDAVHQVKK